MPIVFSPIRPRRAGVLSDLSISFRRYKSGSCALEVIMSPAVQERIRYVDGDKVVVTFDEVNKSILVERVGPKVEGYKIDVTTPKQGKSKARSRLGCNQEQGVAVLGKALEPKTYELFEINGNIVTFVESAS